MKNHNPKLAVAKLDRACQRERKSRQTFKSYKGHLIAFVRYLSFVDTAGWTSEQKVSGFLETLCVLSSSNQRQAAYALKFFYSAAKGQPLGDLPKWAYGKKTKKLPSWLAPEECLCLFRHMKGQPRLMAEIMFGSGLRLKEVLKLRVQDIDLNARTIKVRAGKGDKWRVTILPESLVAPLQEQIQFCRDLWKQDRAGRINPVKLPEGLERKFPHGGDEFEWYWLFPSEKLARCTGYRDRWHLHENTFGNALRAARRKAAIGKRVTAHVLRHSFATAALMNGLDIYRLSKLLGHANINTTAVYLHCLPSQIESVESPLDRALKGDSEKITQFPTPPDSQNVGDLITHHLQQEG